jgi:hypothetical protein
MAYDVDAPSAPTRRRRPSTSCLLGWHDRLN